MPRKPKPRKGQLLAMVKPYGVFPEFALKHGYLYTMVGSYSAVTMKGNMYRVQSVASGEIVHMHADELEIYDENR